MLSIPLAHQKNRGYLYGRLRNSATFRGNRTDPTDKLYEAIKTLFGGTHPYTTKVSNTENAERGLLPYPVIIAATKGDLEAMNIVV